MPPTVLTSSFFFFLAINCSRSIFSVFFPDQVEVAYLRAARAGILEKVLNFLNEDGDIHTCNAVSERLSILELIVTALNLLHAILLALICTKTK